MMFVVDSIGMLYNFYNNKKIEIRVNDFLFMISDNLMQFYVYQADDVYEVENIFLDNNNQLCVSVLSESFVINTDSSYVLNVWQKFFGKKFVLDIKDNETCFDIVISQWGVENVRIYQNSLANGDYFIDFLFDNNGYDILTYRPFTKNRVKKVLFFENKWVVLLDDDSEVEIKVDLSDFMLLLLKESLMIKCD